jgi:Rod binding domain-containing protein
MPTGPSMEALQRLRGGQAKSFEQEKVRLKKATKEFESFFLYQLLKSMRKTVPESSLAGNTPMAGGMGKKVFTDMFDMELGRRLTTSRGKSIADLMYGSMERVVEARYSDDKKISPQDTGQRMIPMEHLRERTPVDVQPMQPIDRSEGTSPIPLSSGVRPKVGNRIREQFGHVIDEAAGASRLDPALIEAVIRAESAGNPRAVSRAGAKGLMQLTDTTAGDLGVRDSLDPRSNVMAGSRYLAALMERSGDLRLALAAYNAGPATVEKYEGIPPYKETKEYVDKVVRLYSVNRTLSADR